MSILGSTYMDRYLFTVFMTTRSGREYSIFVQTMSGDELSDTNNGDRQAEPSLTQMLQALLADHEEERRWE